jgi:hypothetical protein
MVKNILDVKMGGVIMSEAWNIVNPHHGLKWKWLALCILTKTHFIRKVVQIKKGISSKQWLMGYVHM